MSEGPTPYGKLKLPLADLVAAEREKQRAKGYDPNHDDLHVEGELGHAAACFAAGVGLWFELTEDGESVSGYSELWPWEGEAEDAIEGKDRPQQIVIAIALLEAEYERLMRATR